MKIIKKGSREELAKYLNAKEVHCKCINRGCTRTLMMQETADTFNLLRIKAGCPIYVTSGFRCSAHNYRVGGVPLSRHTAGLALDLACPESLDFNKFYELCKSVFPFVLAYKSKNFCHCDIDIR